MSIHGNFLYKYRSIDRNNIDRSKSIFEKCEVYFSTADDFNDPFDCRFGYSFEAEIKESKEYLRRLVKKQSPGWNRQQREKWISKHLKSGINKTPEFIEEFEKRIDQMRSRIGIFSLSTVPNDILMWSHYADCHRGYCLQFIDDETDPFIGRAQEVTYSKEFPILNPIKDNEMERLVKSLLTKAKHWECEKEWRILDHKDGPGIKTFPRNLLAGVIFGFKMNDDDKSKIRNWCHDHHPKISFYQARQAARSYSIEIDSI